MPEYKSNYKELSFYVNGEQKSFAAGRYYTEDKEEMEVLESMKDVTKAEKETVQEVPAEDLQEKIDEKGKELEKVNSKLEPEDAQTITSVPPIDRGRDSDAEDSPVKETTETGKVSAKDIAGAEKTTVKPKSTKNSK